MENFFAEQFSPSNIAANLMWSLILTMVFRLAMWVFHVTSLREKWYWILVPVAIFTFIVAIHAIGVGRQDAVSVKISVDAFSVGTTLERGPGFLLITSVRNVGMPTVLESWHAHVRWAGGQETDVSPIVMPETITLNQGAGRSVTYGPSDSMVTKMMTPIQTGSMVRGLLVYLIPAGYTDQDLVRAETRILVVDVTGTKHWVPVDMNARSPSMPSWPGVGSYQ